MRSSVVLIVEGVLKRLPSLTSVEMENSGQPLQKRQETEKLNQDIEQMVKTLPEFDSVPTAKSKLSTFLK